MAIGTLDPRFSDPAARPSAWEDVDAVLAAAGTYWLTTVRADGRPHAREEPLERGVVPRDAAQRPPGAGAGASDHVAGVAHREPALEDRGRHEQVPMGRGGAAHRHPAAAAQCHRQGQHRQGQNDAPTSH